MKLYSMPEPKFQALNPDKTVFLHDYHIEAPAEWSAVTDRLTALAFLNGPKPLRMIEDSAYGKEAYRMTIDEDAITVLTGGVRGGQYAVYMLLQAAIHSKVPTGIIEDYPVMDMRGFCFNFRGPFRHLPVETVCAYLRSCGRAKINTLMMEYDTRFDHEKYQPVNPWTFSDEDMKKIQVCAAEEGIELIPLIQTCGHLSFLLEQPHLAHLREEADVFDQLCPSKPESFEFAKELIDMYVEKHPGIRYLHIGGDETRQLGHCPTCADYAKEHGKGGLYTRYMNKVIDYVCSKGITPLIYDDMVCAHPEAMTDLDRRAILVYWDYWTTSDPSPLLVARGGHEWAIVRDKSWDEADFAGLSDVQRNIFKTFGIGCDLKNELSPEYLERYTPYLGDRFPKYVKAFPYLEYYRDQGFRVISMPTALGNTDNYLGAPNQPRFIANIRCFAERSVEAGAYGMLTSDWFPFPEAAYPFGITLAGQYAWGMPDYQEGIYRNN